MSVTIDGKGDVWVGIKKHFAAGTKAGDLTHPFTGGTVQAITDVNIDPVGRLGANNWNSFNAATAENPMFVTSNSGGGPALTIIYSLAGSVKPPCV